MGRLSEKEREFGRLESELADLQLAIEQKEAALTASRETLEEVQAAASQAEEEARQAEAAVAGSLMGETVYRLEGLSFESGRTTLTAESRALLDQLADRLRAEDVAYYLEIQTSRVRSGTASELASARAEEVRRYLHVDRGLPLHAVGTVAGSDAQKLEGGIASDGEALLEVLPDANGSPGEAQLAILVVRGQPKS